MKSLSLFLGALATISLLGAGCQTNTPIVTDNTTTILVSSAESTKFCNGDDMDSDGFRKTITVEKSITLPENQTPSERAKSIVVASAQGMCQQVLQSLDITVSSGTVTIPPIDGWAGISIAFCSCKPLVEVNALRIPGISNVQWE